MNKVNILLALFSSTRESESPILELNAFSRDYFGSFFVTDDFIEKHEKYSDEKYGDYYCINWNPYDDNSVLKNEGIISDAN
mgnify:CR=1 FL=1